VKEVASAVTGDEELEIETPLMEAGEFSKDSGLSDFQAAIFGGDWYDESSSGDDSDDSPFANWKSMEAHFPFSKMSHDVRLQNGWFSTAPFPQKLRGPKWRDSCVGSGRNDQCWSCSPSGRAGEGWNGITLVGGGHGGHGGHA